MTAQLFLLFIVCLFGSAFSGPCQDSDLLYIINRGSGMYLGVDENNTVILNNNYQQWCLNDQSRSFYIPLYNLDRYTNDTGIVFYNANGENVIEVRDGVLNNAVLDLIPIAEAVCHETEFAIIYLADSGMFTIQTVIQNTQNLAIAAVSSVATDGVIAVTLSPFDPTDVKQQWIIQH